MAVLANDTFSGESDETFLSAHTPDSGFGGWETNLTEEPGPAFTGAFVSSAGIVQVDTSGGTGAYRCTDPITDTDIRAWIEIQRVSTSSQILPRITYLVKAPTSGIHYQEGVGFQIFEVFDDPGNIAEIRAVRFHQDGPIESSTLISDFAWSNSASKRIGLTLEGTLLTIYEADLGTGDNETTIGTFVLGSISTTGLSGLDDGFHKGCSIFSLASVEPFLTNVWKIDEVAIESNTVSQSAVIDFELQQAVVVSQTAVVDYEQILTIPVSQTAIVDFELAAPAVLVSQQAIIDYESFIIKKLFCPEPAPATIVTTCPPARTIKCIR